MNHPATHYIGAHDIADALVTWAAFYANVKAECFTRSAVFRNTGRYTLDLRLVTAQSLDVPRYSVSVTDAALDEACELIYNHYTEEREALKKGR